MIKMYPFYLLCCTAGLTIAFTGCNKLEERLEKDPLATVDQCQVSSMAYSYSSDTIGVTFTYNKWGDPVRVTQTLTGTGHPDGVFRYDNKRRLTDYIGAYDNDFFEFWHRYVYDKKDRVIRDTVYFFGVILNGEPDYAYDAAVVTYEYDQYGRIAHTSQVWLDYPGHPLDTYYSYDGKGNLVIPGVTYDDKVSIHRTNRIWMFIDRNYSLNNGYTTAWNANELPTNMQLSDQGGQFAGFYYGNLDNITYQCKGDSPF